MLFQKEPPVSGGNVWIFDDQDSLRLERHLVNTNQISTPTMRSSQLYWHIYPREQIRSNFRGNLVFVLEVPWQAGCPVLRNIFDPTGEDFPKNPCRFPEFSRADYHGILYAGVNKTAVYELMLSDPPLLQADADYALYNREIVAGARNFFLIDPNLGFKTMPQHMAQLL